MGAAKKKKKEFQEFPCGAAGEGSGIVSAAAQVASLSGLIPVPGNSTCHNCSQKKKSILENSLVRIQCFHCYIPGSVSGLGTEILHQAAACLSQKKKKKKIPNRQADLENFFFFSVFQVMLSTLFPVMSINNHVHVDT